MQRSLALNNLELSQFLWSGLGRADVLSFRQKASKICTSPILDCSVHIVAVVRNDGLPGPVRASVLPSIGNHDPTRRPIDARGVTGTAAGACDCTPMVH